MQVRRLQEDDVEAFWRLRLRGFLDEPDAFGASYDEAASRPLEAVKKDLAGADVFVVGAFTPDLVGIAGLQRETRRKRRHRASLWGMHVLRSARGHGVGRALVDEIIRQARAIDVEQIILTVMTHNAAAIALYTRAGFVEYGRAPRAMLLDGRSYDETLMLLDVRGGAP